MTNNIEQARELRKAALAAADSNPDLAQSLHRKSQAIFESPEAVGELGLPLSEFGSVIQSLARVLVDRGHDQDQVIHQLRDGNFHGWFDESVWWENTGGKIVDGLAELLDLPAFPEEDPS